MGSYGAFKPVVLARIKEYGEAKLHREMQKVTPMAKHPIIPNLEQEQITALSKEIIALRNENVRLKIELSIPHELVPEMAAIKEDDSEAFKETLWWKRWSGLHS